MTITTRRQVLVAALAAGGASLFAPRRTRAQPYEKGAALEPSRVERLVAAAHGRIETVRELLQEDQGLANACWDWGGGDFETALGAASHTGQRDIALLLLEHGARLDVFAAAMLGMTEVVGAAIRARPLTRFTLGPHGIPLLQHAVAGGEPAAGVVACLRSLAQADDRDRDFPLSRRELRWYEGAYADAAGERSQFSGQGSRLVWVSAAGERPLRALGNHEFVPLDDANSLLSFQFRHGHARTLSIVRGETSATFARVD